MTTERPKARKPRVRVAAAPTTPDPIEIAMEAEAHDGSADSPARRLLIKQGRLLDYQLASECMGIVLKVLTGAAGDVPRNVEIGEVGVARLEPVGSGC